MADKFGARVNLRLTQDTYDAYKEVAELLETDTTSLIRLFVDANVPALEAMGQAARSVRAGQAMQGVAVLEQLAQTMAAQAQLYQASTTALHGEVEAKLSQPA